MRLLSRSLLFVIFASMCLGAPISIVDHAGTQADPALIYASPTVSAVFADTYTGVELARIDVEVTTPEGAPAITIERLGPFVSEVGTYRVSLRDDVAALANGLYRLRVRVWDTYGNTSEWSEYLWASKQWRQLERPGGCRTIP